MLLNIKELHALIFLPGLSTATQLTDVSGRVVGMDVVGDAICRLNGTIRVDSETGSGTTFTIQLPTTLGVARAVLVQSSGHTFAIPMPSIKQIHRLDPESVSCDEDGAKADLGDRNIGGSVVNRTYFPNNHDMGSDLSLCTSLVDPERPQFFERSVPLWNSGGTSRGGRWWNAHLMITGINTVLPPNSPTCPIRWGTAWQSGVFSVASRFVDG